MDNKFYEVTYLCPDYHDEKTCKGNKAFITVSYKSKKTILPISVERASDLMAECEIKGFATINQTKDAEIFQRYTLGESVVCRIKENPNIKKIYLSENGKFTILGLVPLAPQEKSYH